MKRIRMGVIGLGQRGSMMLANTLSPMKEFEITCLCDGYADRIESAKQAQAQQGNTVPFFGTDYKQFLDRKYMDAVYIATSWETHLSVAIDFLRAGIAVALEVGGGSNEHELIELVRAYEDTKTPFMFMENCCYDKNELLATAMTRDGLFGEIVQCSGSYSHDLRQEIAYGKEKRHYRLQHYLHENCENYPTHELGPIAKLLDIGRGNRMVSLVSVGSKAAGLEAYVLKHQDNINPELIGKKFAQSDIVDTIITCENGETIRLKLDTTLPRSYDREFTVRGTKGLYNQSLNFVFFDGDEEGFEIENFHRKNIGNASVYEKQYLPDFWRKVTKKELEMGHGGMDGFMFRAFVRALTLGEEMPIDVYDAAAWMCISYLSAQSIQNGGAPIAIPDFTKGAYKNRPRKDVF